MGAFGSARKKAMLAQLRTDPKVVAIIRRETAAHKGHREWERHYERSLWKSMVRTAGRLMGARPSAAPTTATDGATAPTAPRSGVDKAAQ